MQSSNLALAITERDALDSQSERDAFEAGYNHAHGIACHNVPVIGTEYLTDSEGRVVADLDNVSDLHGSICYEAEMNARCFSPWEHTAHRINSLEEFEAAAAWDAYEMGVAAAIAHDLAGYTYEVES